MSFYDAIRVGASGASDYEVERSLRFNDDDNAHLSRTPSSASNRKTWTISAWVKRCNLGSSNKTLFNAYGGGSRRFRLFFNSSDQIEYNQGGDANSGIGASTAKFRDVNAWYHFVFVADYTNGTAANRFKVYVNNSEIEMSFSDDVENADGQWNGNWEHDIGIIGSSTTPFDGYMAEINVIDGQAYDPSYFAETDPVTGQWNPKKYVGSYGTNGFYLNFSDNSGTTATTLGKDNSGNGNNFTPNNFSVSAGAGNDSLEDSPTNNFCTLSPLLTDTRSDSSFTQGNLTVTTGSGASTVGTTFAQTTGKWYAEFVCTAKSSVNMMIGVNSVEGFDGERQGNESQNGGVGYGYINNGNNALPDGSNNSYGATWAINDVMSIALDLDNNTVNFYKNNAAQGTISIADGYNYVMTCGHGQGGVTATFDVNFGQRAFSYTPPTGFKALNSANLPDPTIKLPNKYFDTLLYTGTNTSSLNNVTGLEFQPDWVWGKSRNDTIGHIFFDAVRGDDRQLEADNNNAEVVRSSAAYRFLSNGFAVSTVGNLNNPVNYVAWNWNAGGSTVTNTNGNISSQVRASTTAGISIVSYSGNGSNGQTVGHGLGVAPDAIILKARGATQNWRVWHRSLAADGSKRLLLDATNASENAGFLNDTAPTSTVFTLGNSDDAWNASGGTYIVYLFSEVAGYSKFGSYTGNGSSDGTFVFTGFRPAWVMIKKTSGTDSWLIMDNKRDIDNVVSNTLAANSSGTENSDTGGIPTDFLSNGFKCRGSGGDFNGSGQTYVYFAFAESPFKNSRAR